MPHTSTELTFTAAKRERYFEDYITGEKYVLGNIVVHEAEMLEFARRYDSQEIHTDRGKAAAGPFNGLIASGWYTGSVMMSLYATHYLSDASSLASPGFDELRWNAPVRAGDTLTVTVAITSARRSRSKPDRGVVKTRVEVLNQERKVVMTIDAINIIACRTR